MGLIVEVEVDLIAKVLGTEMLVVLKLVFGPFLLVQLHVKSFEGLSGKVLLHLHFLCLVVPLHRAIPSAYQRAVAYLLALSADHSFARLDLVV